MNEIPLPPESQEIQLVGTPKFTAQREVKYLCWLARQATGNILEIGCNVGHTTLELATACPDKIIFACDWTGDPTMDPAQGGQPSREQMCSLARLRNVAAINCRSWELPYEYWNLGMIFIDGDHSDDGVRKDSEKALEYFSGAPAVSGAKRYIVWHDCDPQAPAWCGVWRYLSGLAADGLPICRVGGTRLAIFDL